MSVGFQFAIAVYPSDGQSHGVSVSPSLIHLKLESTEKLLRSFPIPNLVSLTFSGVVD
jgi:hypothetical protein